MSEPIVTAEQVREALESSGLYYLPTASNYLLTNTLNALLAPKIAERERQYAELILCVRGLLAWKGDQLYIRDTNGSRKQLKLVVKVLAELEAAAPKVSESQKGDENVQSQPAE